MLFKKKYIYHLLNELSQQSLETQDKFYQLIKLQLIYDH